jgi:putative membrane-bound dehydrogenase-like protein
MKPSMRLTIFWGCSPLLVLGGLSLLADKRPQTGPATEKRFPPLKVPPHFKATLFACDPLIEYPSVIARGPRLRSLFVAVDYMTGLGTEIVRRSEIRLIEDTDGDGYADKATVFARGFNSIQGLAYDNGTLYVMHAPFLTALRDTKGKGIADKRQDLLSGLGLTPEDNPVRLHCANGVVVGHDGWLYLALGDHGCRVKRPEGDRLVLEGGGILRCRADGRDLHVFATGLRNIYDVALDEDLNVFVRDNENDGGDYMVRVCHSFFGADHGYPYLYYEHPEEALPPLADLGRGSSAGGVCYLERQFPPAYHGNLLFCEWGRSVVRYQPRRAGSGFAPLKEIEFASGAANDPYGFKPTDLVVDRDGALFVSDWADDQRPKRGRGRIYRITSAGKGVRSRPSKPLRRDAPLARWIARLDSESSWERSEAQWMIASRGKEAMRGLNEALDKGRLGVGGRLHAIWILARAGGRSELGRLLAMVNEDAEPRVQAQAVRALADLTDPVLTGHRLNAGRGDSKVADQLARLARGKHRRVLREMVIALGRLRWRPLPGWLRQTLTKPDPPLAHAAMQALRRLEDWPAVLRLMDGPDGDPLRPIALRAVAGRAVPELVDGLIDRLGKEPVAVRRRPYAELLTRVYKKPGPWVYWGYRPPPRPANILAWERTEAIAQALDRALTDRDPGVRQTVLTAMRREKILPRLATLGRWLQEETQVDRVAALLAALREQPAGAVRRQLAAVVANKKHTESNRLAALRLFARGLDESSEGRLLELAGAVEDSAVLAEILRCLGKRPRLRSRALLVRKTESPRAVVRAAALLALAEHKAPETVQPVSRLLGDKNGRVRAAAAQVAGEFKVKPAIPTLLKLTGDPEPAVRRASLTALRQLREGRAVVLAVAGLQDQETELVALDCLADLGGPEQAGAVTDLAKRHPSADVLTRAVRLLSTWCNQTTLPATHRRKLFQDIATVQGASGTLLCWQVKGPVRADRAAEERKEVASGAPFSFPQGKAAQGWRTRMAEGTEIPLHVKGDQAAGDKTSWFACTDIRVPSKTTVQFLVGSSGTLKVWLNGRLAHRHGRSARFVLDSDRFSAALARGANRVLVEIASPRGPVTWHLRFRSVSSRAEHEKLTQAALTRPGDPDRGRAIFLNIEKSQCLKCHRLGDRGERIGPELTGVGARFSRIYLVESILDPSRTIAPSYQTILVTLTNGKQLMGVRVAETEKTLTLADRDGKKHMLARGDIEEQQPQAQSTMPEGLEKRLTEQEFIDLIAFLAAEKGKRN